MDREKLRTILDIAVLIAIFVACALMLAFLFTALTEGGSCVYNPLSYWEVQNNKTICGEVLSKCMLRP